MKTIFGCMRFIIGIEVMAKTVYINFTIPGGVLVNPGRMLAQVLATAARTERSYTI